MKKQYQTNFFVLSTVIFTAIFPTFSQIPTWADNIAPILYNNCTSCHIEGGIAPFSLVGYQKAKDYASSIKSSTQNRRMPPWPADPQYKRYAHERILSTEEIKAISDWVDGGKPEGNLANAPANPTLVSGSKMQNPTRTLRMPNYNLQTFTDEYRCFVLPTNLTSPQFLTEIEVVPGSLKAVHHVLVFYDTSKIPVKLDSLDPNPGYLGFGGTGSNTSTLIGMYVPGSEPFKFPSGMGVYLPPNGNIILQMHYPPGLSNTLDSTKVLLKTSTNLLRPLGIASVLNHGPGNLINGPLYIPANQKRSFTSTFKVNLDATVFAIGPHMHQIGTSIKSFGVLSNNKDTIKLVNIPKWDFNWQRQYTFKNLTRIPANTTLYAVATYDNTSSNPTNANKIIKDVSLGEGTGDEMLLVYFFFTGYQIGDENTILDNTPLKNIGSLTNSSKFPVSTAAQINVFPNPASDIVKIFYTNPISGSLNQSQTLRIYDTKGKLIHQSKINLGGGFELNIAPLSSGVYWIQIETASGNIASRKIIVQR